MAKKKNNNLIINGKDYDAIHKRYVESPNYTQEGVLEVEKDAQEFVLDSKVYLENNLKKAKVQKTASIITGVLLGLAAIGITVASLVLNADNSLLQFMLGAVGLTSGVLIPTLVCTNATKKYKKLEKKVAELDENLKKDLANTKEMSNHLTLGAQNLIRQNAMKNIDKLDNITAHANQEVKEKQKKYFLDIIEKDITKSVDPEQMNKKQRKGVFHVLGEKKATTDINEFYDYLNNENNIGFIKRKSEDIKKGHCHLCFKTVNIETNTEFTSKDYKNAEEFVKDILAFIEKIKDDIDYKRILDESQEEREF